MFFRPQCTNKLKYHLLEEDGFMFSDQSPNFYSKIQMKFIAVKSEDLNLLLRPLKFWVINIWARLLYLYFPSRLQGDQAIPQLAGRSDAALHFIAFGLSDVIRACSYPSCGSAAGKVI